MTQAKRYEGEKARGVRWHSLQRDVGHVRRVNGDAMVLANIPFSFFTITRLLFDKDEAEYKIQLELYIRSPAEIHTHPIFTWIEHMHAYPSDLLLTKLILITGGK